MILMLPAPARALTLTAVNDTLLPLDDSTMPQRLGGELYVPYSVFSSLDVSSSLEGGVLSMSSNGETLNFSLDEGYVYDAGDLGLSGRDPSGAGRYSPR